MEGQKRYGLQDHWKCALACLLVSMSPFQYGVDFGLIGPMQAMVGFLKVLVAQTIVEESISEYVRRFSVTRTPLHLLGTTLAPAFSS